MICLVREGRSVVPHTRIRPDGSEHRDIEMPVTRLRRMPVEEFIIGANQDIVAGTDRALRLLTDLKYPDPSRRLVVSKAATAVVI
jgi:hypothetical protein